MKQITRLFICSFLLLLTIKGYSCYRYIEIQQLKIANDRVGNSETEKGARILSNDYCDAAKKCVQKNFKY